MKIYKIQIIIQGENKQGIYRYLQQQLQPVLLSRKCL